MTSGATSEPAVAVVADGTGGGWLRDIDPPAGSSRSGHSPDRHFPDLRPPAAGMPVRVGDLAAAVAAREAGAPPRWVWASTAAIYPDLLRAGVRVARCHDLELTESLLLGYAGRWGEPRSVAAVLARRDRRAVPPDPPPPAPRPPGQVQDGLFEMVPPPAGDSAAGGAGAPGDNLVAAFADQRARIEGLPRRFRLLVAAESAGALAAAEMGNTGLPWRVDIHHRVLTELLGDRSPMGGLPRRLASLSAAIAEALGAPGLHPDSPAELRRALARAGIEVPDTRAWSLRGIAHPAIPLVLEFKELYRLWTAHGWNWVEAWVRDGRFHPEYVPGGVVSGRWATRGGGALQIPKVIRRAVVADSGWRLVVADAGQLEPRILAAVSGDPRLSAAAAAGDLYAALARESFGGDRARAKLALLGAMYGQTGGSALPALAVLRQRYPVAWRYVEQAAQTGEAGGLVRSWLGRTAPAGSGGDPRAHGRFTRNFVIQATAAEWALTLLALLRTDLAGQADLAGRTGGRGPDSTRGRLVFFQHDEVLVHCPVEQVEAVVAAVGRAAAGATRLLFGDTPVQFPLDTAAVDCYADAA